MRLYTKEELQELLKSKRISRRLVRDLRYVPDEIAHADLREFLTATTKSGNEGVLLYEESVLPFELKRRSPNKNGRIEAIICDFCATWRRGTASAVITFTLSDKHTVSHLVCADLDCSLHVRDMTPDSKVSRTQLREHITSEGRVERLRERLDTIAQPNV